MLNLRLLCNFLGSRVFPEQDDCHIMGVIRRIADLKIDHI